MAIGPISSPATWLLGTIVAPSFQQNVEDNINGWITGTGTAFKSLNIDGIGAGAAAANVPGLLIGGASSQLRTSQTATPAVSFFGGAGTGPSSSGTFGSDLAGKLIVGTGTGPTGSGSLICNVTFSAAFAGTGTSVVLFPGNTISAAYSGLYVSTTNSLFQLISGAAALTASSTYVWYWVAIGV